MQTRPPPIVSTDRTERLLILFAGGMLLWVILAGFGIGPLLHQVPTNGSFADSAAAFSAGERQYRFAAAASLIVTLSGVVLAFALYELLRRINRSVALIALIFFLLDSVLGLFERAVDRDKFFSATEAKDFGLVDEVFDKRPEPGEDGGTGAGDVTPV